ncbi:MAG: hypothetical protein ACRDQI_11435 [Pseudonocardiaceae bacterium]
MVLSIGLAVLASMANATNGAWLALAVLGAATIAVATVTLARSPLLQGSRGQSEGPPPAVAVHPAGPTPAGALAPPR